MKEEQKRDTTESYGDSMALMVKVVIESYRQKGETISEEEALKEIHFVMGVTGNKLKIQFKKKEPE
jgi:hypothetical protein